MISLPYIKKYFTQNYLHCIYAFARCFCSKKLALHCGYDFYLFMYSLRIKPIIYSLSFIQNWIKTIKSADITQGFFCGVLASGQKTHFTQLHTAVLLEINTVSVRRRAHRAAEQTRAAPNSWENSASIRPLSSRISRKTTAHYYYHTYTATNHLPPLCFCRTNI